MNDNFEEQKSRYEDAVLEETADDEETTFRTELDSVENLEDVEEFTESAETETVVQSGKKKAQNKNVDVWDDSVLIEAWESAVREYQEYHSPNATKAVKKVNSTSQRSPSTKPTTQKTGSQNNKQKPTDSHPYTTSQPKATTIVQEPAEQNTSKSSTASTPSKRQTEKDQKEAETENQNVPQQGATPYPYAYPYPYPPTSSWGYDPNYAYYYPQHAYAYPPNQPAAAPTVAGATPPVPPLDAGASEMKSNFPGTIPNLAGIDDENLSNVIMSWYFAGYYTGLYQASKK